MSPDFPSDAIRQQRSHVELQFRRGIIRFCQAILVLLAAYLAIGLLILRAPVLAQSDAPHSHVPRRIVVRQIWSTPLWAWPVARMIEHSPQHRFEYYHGPALWSCQSYAGGNYRANHAHIDWDTKGTA